MITEQEMSMLDKMIADISSLLIAESEKEKIHKRKSNSLSYWQGVYDGLIVYKQHLKLDIT